MKLTLYNTEYICFAFTLFSHIISLTSITNRHKTGFIALFVLSPELLIHVKVMISSLPVCIGGDNQEAGSKGKRTHPGE